MSIVFFFDQKGPRRHRPHRTRKTIEDPSFLSRPQTARHRLRRKSAFPGTRKKKRTSFLTPSQGQSSSDEAPTPLLLSPSATRPGGGANAFCFTDKGGVSGTSEEAAREQIEKLEGEEAEGSGIPALPCVSNGATTPPLRSVATTAITNSRLKILLEVEEEGDEDNQEQYNFQEAQFAAPGILQQLSKLLYFSDSQDVVEWCPEHLVTSLRSEHRTLVHGVRIPKRQWQTVSYQYTEQMSRQQRLSDVQLPAIVMEADGGGYGNKLDDEKRRDLKNRKVVVDMSATYSEVEMLKEQKKQSGEEAGAVPGIFSLSREMSKSPHGPRPRTRLERYHAVGVQERGNMPVFDKQIHIGTHSHYEEALKDFSGMTVRGPMQTINFALSSNFAAERGWVKEPADSEDPERRTLLDWLRERTKKIKKQREVEKKEAERKGSNGPLIVRCYGKWPKVDAARLRFETRMKHARLRKQGLDPSVDDPEEGCLMRQLPDGTAFCYYPSGHTAVCRTSGGPGHSQKFTYMYDNNKASTMLACFLPFGKGCVYHKQGSIRALMDCDGGSLFDEDGMVTRKWKWPSNGMKLLPSVVLQLNEQIQLRCLSQTSITVYFTCQQETVKFLLSDISPQSVTRQTSSSDSVVEERLMTNIQFLSQTALDMSSTPTEPRPSSRKGKKKSTSSSGSVSQKKKEQEMSVTDSVLDTIDEEADDDLAFSTISTDLRFSLNLKVLEQTEADLQTIQEQTKLLTNEWMDHYRKTLGISVRSSPYNTPTREILSSRQRHRSAEDPARAATTDGGRWTPIQDMGVRHRRSVSAEPPRPMTRGSSSPMPELQRGSRSRMGYESVVRFEPRKIPLVYDTVYDFFIHKELPRNQMLVVYISDSRLGPDSSGCDEMLERIYYSHNKNRIKPSSIDSFRIVRYNLAVAAEGSTHDVPLLQRRHNAVPGMIFIYQGGRLLFANKIFNGYSNMKKDFMKQIMKSADDFRHGRFLLSNFRFGDSAARSRCPEKAWVEPGSVDQLSEVSFKRRTSPVSPIGASPITAIGFITQSLSSEENLSRLHASHFHELHQRTGTSSHAKSPAGETVNVSAIVGNA